MNELLKKFATKLSDAEFQNMCAYPFEKIASGRINIDVSAEICDVLGKEGIVVEAAKDAIYVMNMQQVEDRLANRIWLEDKVIPHIKVAAKAKSVVFTRSECKHQVEIGTPEAEKHGLSGIPGRIYCHLWRTQVENVVQVNGKCVPTRFFTQGTPESGTNQWGTEGKHTGNIPSCPEHTDGFAREASLEALAFPARTPRNPRRRTPAPATPQTEATAPVSSDRANIAAQKAIKGKMPLIESFMTLKEFSEEEVLEFFRIINQSPRGASIRKTYESHLSKIKKPELTRALIEEHLADYSKIDPDAIKAYIASISDDEEKVINLLKDPSLDKMKDVFENMASAYLGSIRGDEGKLVRALNEIVPDRRRETSAGVAFENAYLDTIGTDPSRLETALKEGIIQTQKAKEHAEESIVTKYKNSKEDLKRILKDKVLTYSVDEANKALFNLVKNDENELDALIQGGFLDTESLGDELKIGILDRAIAAGEDKFLSILTGGNFDMHFLSKYLKQKFPLSVIEQVQKPELIKEIVKGLSPEVNLLNTWVMTTQNSLVEGAARSVLGDRLKDRLYYMKETPEQTFERTRGTTQYAPELKNIKPGGYETYKSMLSVENINKLVNQVESLVNSPENKGKYPWGEFKKKFPKLVSKYPNLLEALRGKGPAFTPETVAAARPLINEEIKKNTPTGDIQPITDISFAFREYKEYFGQQSIPKSFEGRSNEFYLQIQANALPEVMSEINTDPFLSAWWEFLQTNSTFSMHGRAHNTIGWSRIVTVKPSKGKPYVFLEELQSDVLDIYRHTGELINSEKKGEGKGLITKAMEEGVGSNWEELAQSLPGANPELTPQENALNYFKEKFKSFNMDRWVYMMVEKILEYAKANGYAYVLMAKDAFKRQQTHLSPSTAKYYYNEIPSEFGFEDAATATDIDLPLKKEDAWIRKASRKINPIVINGFDMNESGNISRVSYSFRGMRKIARFNSEDLEGLYPEQVASLLERDEANRSGREFRVLVASLSRKAAGELDNIRARFESDVKNVEDKVGLAHRFLAKVKQMLGDKATPQVMQKWVAWTGDLIGERNLGVAATFDFEIFPVVYGMSKEAAGELDSLRERFAKELTETEDEKQKVSIAHKFLYSVRQLLKNAGKFTDEVFKRWVDWAGEKLGKPIGVAAGLIGKTTVAEKVQMEVCENCNGYGILKNASKCEDCDGTGMCECHSRTAAGPQVAEPEAPAKETETPAQTPMEEPPSRETPQDPRVPTKHPKILPKPKACGDKRMASLMLRKAGYEEEVNPKHQQFWTSIPESHPFHGHPVYTQHGNELARKSYDYSSQKIQQKQMNPKSMVGVQEVYHKILELEAEHEGELTELATKVVSQLFHIDPNMLAPKLGEPEGGAMKEPEPEGEQGEPEKAELTPDLQKQVHKRQTMNTLTHGSAMHSMMSMHYMVDNAIKSISPELLDLYTKLALMSNQGYWLIDIESMLAMAGESEIGEEQVEFEETDEEDEEGNKIEKPIVKATGVCFPALCHELVKGVMELFTMNQLSSMSEPELRTVYEQADRFQDEPYHLQVGPEIWRRFLASMPEDSDIGMVVANLSKREPDYVHDFISKVISNPQAAQSMIGELLEG